MIKIPCPHCGTRLTVPEAKVGKNGRCPECRELFVVPRPLPARRRLVQPAVDDDSSLVIEDDEDDSSRVIDSDETALEIVDFLDGATGETSRDSRFRTEVVAETTDFPREVLTTIRTAIKSHRNVAADGVFPEADLHISVDEYDPGSRFLRYMFPFLAGAARVKMSVSGTVNGETISFAPSTGIHAARYIGFLGGESEGMLEACLQDCIGDICLIIDKAAGRQRSSYARVWGQLQFVRWIVAAFVFVAFLGISLVLHPLKPGDNRIGKVVGLVVVSLFASAASAGTVTAFGMFVAPSDFLLNHPNGRKLMRRTGVKSPGALSFAAILIFLISLCAFGLPFVVLTTGR